MATGDTPEAKRAQPPNWTNSPQWAALTRQVRLAHRPARGAGSRASLATSKETTEASAVETYWAAVTNLVLTQSSLGAALKISARTVSSERPAARATAAIFGVLHHPRKPCRLHPRRRGHHHGVVDLAHRTAVARRVSSFRESIHRHRRRLGTHRGLAGNRARAARKNVTPESAPPRVLTLGVPHPNLYLPHLSLQRLSLLHSARYLSLRRSPDRFSSH
jgi:hypothetical protein